MFSLLGAWRHAGVWPVAAGRQAADASEQRAVLVAAILMAAAVWYLVLLVGSPMMLPRISSLCALIWGRPLPLLGAAMVVVGEQTTVGDLDSTNGSRAQPQWLLFTWSFVFIAAMLLLQAEGRPTLSSLLVCA